MLGARFRTSTMAMSARLRTPEHTNIVRTKIVCRSTARDNSRARDKPDSCRGVWRGGAQPGAQGYALLHNSGHSSALGCFGLLPLLLAVSCLFLFEIVLPVPLIISLLLASNTVVFC